jgi:hypothetical protein
VEYNIDPYILEAAVELAATIDEKVSAKSLYNVISGSTHACNVQIMACLCLLYPKNKRIRNHWMQYPHKAFGGKTGHEVGEVEALKYLKQRLMR